MIEDTTLLDRACDAHRNFSLVGSSIPSGVLSPYFQSTDTRKEAPIRDTQIISIDMLKAFILGYEKGGATANVNFFLKDDAGPNTGSVGVPLTIAISDTAATIAASIPGVINTWCTANLSVVPDVIEWIVNASTVARSESTLSLTVQTSTGAVGTQVSSTQDALVFVSENISTTASIAGNAADDLVVEVAPTNSATVGDWVEKARGGQSQAVSLAITLQSVQVIKGVLPVYVPKGYYIKVRSVGSSGTFSNGVSNSRAVLL